MVYCTHTFNIPQWGCTYSVYDRQHWCTVDESWLRGEELHTAARRGGGRERCGGGALVNHPPPRFLIPLPRQVELSDHKAHLYIE
jgi:hypothetical protein